MTELTPTNAVAELAALYNCDDGVVKGVDFSCGVSAEQKTCVVSIECVSLDPRFVGTGPVNKSGRGTWVCAKFRIQGVSELKFEMVGSTFEFLESGVQLVWRNDQVFLFLDAHPEDGPGLPDLKENIAYVAGRECFLEVEPLGAD